MGWGRHCIKYLKNTANLTYRSIPAVRGEDVVTQGAAGNRGAWRGRIAQCVEDLMNKKISHRIIIRNKVNQTTGTTISICLNNNKNPCNISYITMVTAVGG
jgi:hypothetical protein